MASAAAHHDVVQHMARHFGPVQDQALVEIVPISGIAINVIPPQDDRDSFILFTTGMSDRPQSVPQGREGDRYTELFIRLPHGWPLDRARLANISYFWPIGWLKRIAAYPHLNETWLGGPFAIIANGEPPEPFAPDTRLSCMLVLREPGDVGTVRCRDSRDIALYSLVPLYTEERDLERVEGMPGLFARFQARGVSPVVSPARVNTAARQKTQ